MLDSTYRRLALQLASQLPEERADALKVLEYLRQLVDVFVAPMPGDQARRDLPFLEGTVSAIGTSPRRLASPKGSPSVLPK